MDKSIYELEVDEIKKIAKELNVEKYDSKNKFELTIELKGLNVKGLTNEGQIIKEVVKENVISKKEKGSLIGMLNSLLSLAEKKELYEKGECYDVSDLTNEIDFSSDEISSIISLLNKKI